MRKLIFPLSLLALWLGACSNETNEPGELSPEKDKIAMTFKVSGSDAAPETRMSYEGTSNGALEIRWDATTPDVIGLFNNGTNNDDVKCKVQTANGNNAKFEDVTLTWDNSFSGTGKVYAYYPYNETAFNHLVDIDISNQEVKDLNKPFDHIGPLDFMVATADVNVAGTTTAQPLSLQFQHILHLVTFEVSGLSSDQIGNLTSITLKATDVGVAPFYTDATLDLTDLSFTSWGTQTESATLKLNNLRVESDKTYYFNMLIFDTSVPYAYEITITTQQGVKKRINKTFSSTYDFNRGEHTLFECTTGWQDVTN